jgi:hypothetical protein
MGDFGEIKNKTKFNYEGDQIYAFKPQPNPIDFFVSFLLVAKLLSRQLFTRKPINCQPARNKGH